MTWPMVAPARIQAKRRLEYIEPKDEVQAAESPETPANEVTDEPTTGPTAEDRQVNVERREDHLRRLNSEGGVDALRAQLALVTPTSLLTEELDDEEENCLEHAAEQARPGQDNVVFLGDQRTADEGNANGAGHTVVEDRETGRVWDSSDGEPPADPAEWVYDDVDAWIEAQGETAAGEPAYTVEGRVAAEHVQEVLALPPEARAARIAEIGDPALSQVAGNLYADGGLFDIELCETCGLRHPEIADYLDSYGQRLPGAEVGAILAGDSDLGELSDLERTQVLDHATNHWRTGYIGEIQALSHFAANEGDPELQDFLQADFAQRAAAYQTGPIADEPHNFFARDLSTELAIQASALAGTPEARREMLELLGAEDATAFALALEPSRDDDDYYIDTHTLYGGGPSDDSVRLQTLGDVLDATTAGEVTDTSAAVLNAVHADLDGDLLAESDELRENLAASFGAHWHPNAPALAEREADRMAGVLGTELGREVLYGDQVPLAGRAEAMALVRGSNWTGEDFTSDDFLEREYLPALAAPRAESFLAGRGDDPIPLTGTNLENTIGFAFGLPPEVPDDETDAEVAEREAAVAAGEYSYYEGNEAIDTVAEQIRNVGGEPPNVTVLPVQYYDDGVAVSVPLFRVQHSETGEDYFVDNIGRSYSSFEKWRDENLLPPGIMTYPANGHLSADEDGEVALVTDPTPETVDTPREHIEQFLDTAALVGGVVAGGALVVGSGGFAAPVVLGATAAWGAYRSGERLLDRHQHGQSINPLSDGAARSEWLNFGANVFSVATAGTAGFAARASRGVSGALRPPAAVAAGYLGTTSAVLDGAAAADATYTLFRDWDELDAQQRANLALSAGFFGVTTLVGAGQNPGRARDLFNPNALRDAYLADVPSSTQQLWRLEDNLPTSSVIEIRDHIHRYVPESRRAEAFAQIEAAAADGNITGLDDWITYSTRTQQATSQSAVLEQFNDNLAELAAARSEANRTGEVFDVGGDARPQFGPDGRQLTSFDITSADGTRNIEVYSFEGAPRNRTFNTALNHAADKIVDDPSIPRSQHTQGSVEAAVVVDWPPPSADLGGARHIIHANGDMEILTPNGEVANRGNLFENYLEDLNEGGSNIAAGAGRVDRLAVVDRQGNLVYEFIHDGQGNWVGQPG